MAQVAIVPIMHDHVESFHQALDFVAQERRYLSFLQAPPLQSTQAFVLDNIRHGYPQWVALSAGEVVGWCDVMPKTREVYAHVGVLGMGLLPPFRQKGIGTMLMERTLAAAQRFGLTRVELTVRENNTGAIALYKKAGFEIEGLQRRAVRIDGVYENVLGMAVLL